VPLVTARSVAGPTGNAVERLQRVVIEAAKQCGRNRLMKIAPPLPWHEWITADGGLPTQRETKPRPEVRRLVAQPGGLPLSEVEMKPPLATFIAVGPEGGFSDEEVNAAIAYGWQCVSLGPRVLRIETAAVALAGAIVFA
jgi:16S rRNA (uracil1498-N3)-methyltransferase